MARDASTFQGEPPAELLSISLAVQEAFGPDEARAMLGVLGPSAAAAPPPPNCECNTIDVYCGWSGDCRTGGCAVIGSGCGSPYIYSCNGPCYN